MGGNALSFKTRRYSADEYGKILFKVTKKLNLMKIENRIPKSYGAKTTFGDLDVLIKSSTVNKGHMRTIIEDTFNPHEIYHNGSVYSFDYKEFQIDFILVPDKEWETSYNYFSYNDLGNLIGRISYQMGFRYGHYGLKLVYRHDAGGKKFEKIISQDIEKILDFLGFNVSEYKIGFYELRDIFAYVIKSKYFNPKIFQYEALNHQNKTRNKKRANYAGFLKYIEGEKFYNPYEYKDKDYYVKMAEDYFGIDIVSHIDSWNKEVEKDKVVSAKFNGNIIMERHPKLRGRELGLAITAFKNRVKPYIRARALMYDDNTDINTLYKDWIISSDIDHIFNHFNLALMGLKNK